jgi:hypothetical protein
MGVQAGPSEEVPVVEEGKECPLHRDGIERVPPRSRLEQGGKDVAELLVSQPIGSADERLHRVQRAGEVAEEVTVDP